MKKRTYKLIVVIIAVLLFITVPVNAAVFRASDYLSVYSAALIKTSTGELSLYFRVTAPAKMDYLGANRIYIQRYTGSYWTTEYTYTYPEEPSLQGENVVRYSQTLIYEPLYSSAQYRAVVVFYAAKGSGSDTGTYTTNSVS